LTKTIVIEYTPISLGLRIRARTMLTTNCRSAAPDDEKKLMTSERRRFAIRSNDGSVTVKQAILSGHAAD
jgi:hypothetical protein